MTGTVPLAVPSLQGNESVYIEECLSSNFVSSVGPYVERFEREFAEYVGSKFAVACVNGTAALHVALRLTGARSGAVVALSDFTFIASANAVSYTGARPWLIDAEPVSWNLDSELLHHEVQRRAKCGEEIPAVIEVVHVLGQPAAMEPLMALRDEFGVMLVEDAAEALGAMWTAGPLQGRQVGTAGDMGCFSFNGNKIITTGGGGMIVTDNKELATRAKHLTTQAKRRGRGYLHDEIGYNYRLTNVAAALGVAQLEQLPGFLDRKREIAAIYTERLASLPLTPLASPPGRRSSYWLFSILLQRGAPDRELVLERLLASGIEARALWPPIHMQTPYAGVEVLGGHVAEDIYARGISLPCSVALTKDEQSRVIEALTLAVV